MNKRQFKRSITSRCQISSERRASDWNCRGPQFSPHWRYHIVASDFVCFFHVGKALMPMLPILRVIENTDFLKNYSVMATTDLQEMIISTFPVLNYYASILNFLKYYKHSLLYHNIILKLLLTFSSKMKVNAFNLETCLITVCTTN